MVMEADLVVPAPGFRHDDIEIMMVVEADLVVYQPGLRKDIKR